MQLSKSTTAGTFSEPKPVATESSAPQAWWQQPTVPPTLASARFVGSPRQQAPLTDAELRVLAPCEVVRQALPLKLANSLLRVLLSDCATWVRGTWYMAGKQHSAPRRSAYFTLNGAKVLPPHLLSIRCSKLQPLHIMLEHIHELHNLQKLDTISSYSPSAARALVIVVGGIMQELGSANGSSQEALDVSSSVDTRIAPEDLQAATTLIAEHVNQIIPSVRNQLAEDDR